MGELGRLIDEYQDGLTPFRPSDAAVARALGVSKSALSKWKRAESMPQPAHVRKLANLTGFRYNAVLDAVLADHGYLPRESGQRGNTPPMNDDPEIPDLSSQAETLTRDEVEPRTPPRTGARRRGAGKPRPDPS